MSMLAYKLIRCLLGVIVSIATLEAKGHDESTPHYKRHPKSSDAKGIECLRKKVACGRKHFLRKINEFEQSCRCEIPIPALPDFDESKPVKIQEEKWALVTGVSRGNGRATAEKLHSLGYTVIGTFRGDTVDGPYDWPKFKPAKQPAIDYLLNLDISKTDPNDDSTDSVKTFCSNLKTLLNGKKVSVIVPSALRLFLGSIKGTYDNAVGNYPYDFSPPLYLPPDPAALDRYKLAQDLAGYDQSSLIQKLLFTLADDQTPLFAMPDVRVVPIISDVAFNRYISTLAPYSAGKRATRNGIDILRAEIANLPGQSVLYPEILLFTCNPTFVNTGGINSYEDYPEIGPLLGEAPFFTIQQYLAMVSQSAAATTPETVGAAIGQAVQLMAPPTDFLVGPLTKLGKETWRQGLAIQFCGDQSSCKPFKGLYADEYSQTGIENSYAATAITSLISYPLVSLISPQNFEPLSSNAIPLVFSGVNLDGENMVWQVSMNNGPYQTVATSFSPANPAMGQLIDLWTTVDPVVFPSGEVALKIKGTTPNETYIYDVNALNKFAISVTAP